MDPITIIGDNFTATLIPDKFFPLTVENTNKFIKLILRPTYGNEVDYLIDLIRILDELIEEIPKRYEDQISKISEANCKTEINEIRVEANRIKRDGERLKRNREDLKKELEAIT